MTCEIRRHRSLPSRQRFRRLLMLSCVIATPFAAMAAEPVPTVSRPPAAGFPFDRAAVDLATFGYRETELLISGTAQA